jgi:uncharacterized protein (DUF1778 family)
MAAKSERIIFRVEPEIKRLLEIAAHKDMRTLGSFLIKAGVDRAQILGLDINEVVPQRIWETYRAG